ncbi:hypothetical protein BASA83_012729 [Batrachochytrium salamandrivorans]|nr:hypothetical protein BASA83_012729 [Batrachochytrium salamandrivorans]
MKLAIASTTLLFAMMAAQAAVLSATSSTDVNLVKRAPNGDALPTSQGPLTDKEQEKMQESFVILSGKTNKLAELIQSQRGNFRIENPCQTAQRTCEGEASSECSNINAEIAEIKEKIAGLKKQLEETTEEYRTGLDGYYRV